MGCMELFLFRQLSLCIAKVHPNCTHYILLLYDENKFDGDAGVCIAHQTYIERERETCVVYPSDQEKKTPKT